LSVTEGHAFPARRGAAREAAPKYFIAESHNSSKNRVPKSPKKGFAAVELRTSVQLGGAIDLLQGNSYFQI
jgi:hypothetical protein